MIIRLTAVLTLLFKVILGGDARYECGPHGRFEYCIDGIPGCVIGCHCHPGYYFDTDAKICEPNTKLTVDTRRNNNNALTSINGPPTTAMPKNGSNEEDLGDWLYNQFFKTIENEVVNKTSADPLTRRSGSKKTKRSKKKKKKKKSKRRKKGKEKLRMDENDSVFQSGESKYISDDSDSSSSSYSSSSDSDDSDSDSSSTGSDRPSRPHRPKDHKHFMMINRNRPPLPSFVFLPNMHTPYFPPFGLPPPLPAPPPMFPVLPVPPLMPLPPCKDNENLTPQNSTTNSPETNNTVPNNQDNNNNGTNDANQNSKENKSSEHTKPNNNSKSGEKNSSEDPGKKRLLRERMRRLKRKRLKSMATRKYTNPRIYPGLNPTRSQNKQVFDNIDHTATNFFNKNVPEDSYMDNEPYSYDDYDAGFQPAQETNVQFKYLSDLIHKKKGPTNITPNAGSQRLSVFEDPLSQPVKNMMLRPIQNGVNQPRINHNKVNDRIARPPDETYYTILGREIASLIRKIDTKGDRQVNIEIEQIPKNTPAFNDNSFGAISNWERRARSPPRAERLPRRYYISSEEMLFRLEDMANVVATTTPTLDLAQIEEAIRFMQQTEHRDQPQHHHKTLPSKNVNIAYTKLNKNKFVDKTLPKNLMLPAVNNIKNKAKFKNNIYQAKRPLLEFFEHFPTKDQIDSYLNRQRLNNTQTRFNITSHSVSPIGFNNFTSQVQKNRSQNSTVSKNNRKTLPEIEGWNKIKKLRKSINFETFIPFGNQRKYKKGSSLSQFPFNALSQVKKMPITNKKTPSYFHQFDDFF